MPRFFIHIWNGTGEVLDPDGIELPGLDAAVQQALLGIRSILSDEVRRGRLDLRGRVEVHDADGQLLRRVPFRDAFDVHLGDEP